MGKKSKARKAAKEQKALPEGAPVSTEAGVPAPIEVEQESDTAVEGDRAVAADNDSLAAADNGAPAAAPEVGPDAEARASATGDAEAAPETDVADNAPETHASAPDVKGDSADDVAVAGDTAAAGAPDAAPRPQPSLVRRIFISLAVVSTIATVVVMALSTLIYQHSQVDDSGRMLDDQARLIASVLRDDDSDLETLEGLNLGEVRLTLINKDGTVAYDSQTDAGEMGNHEDRPEVQEAQRRGKGSAERDSETVGKISIYRSVLLDDGRVLRLSVDRDGAMAAISHDMAVVALVAGLIVAACWFVSRFVADRLMRPILDIDPKAPDPASSYLEVAPLLQKISEQIDDLKDSDLMRREFTSNVTHELKTPLSSIQGAAELIRDGIARPEDVPNFAGRIYDEARHMTGLVNEILVLSKLDEAERSQSSDALLGKQGPADLLRMSEAVADRLRPNAESAGVTISVTGSSASILGLPRLLDELAYNLCDNAIRYNREGGRVDVWAGLVDGKPTLRVADTGIGIPKASQRKVFERFYRVDSSRARQTGGTGLGLAIVKHAAAYHGADITLTSEEGMGTTVTVTFPEDRRIAVY